MDQFEILLKLGQARRRLVDIRERIIGLQGEASTIRKSVYENVLLELRKVEELLDSIRLEIVAEMRRKRKTAPAKSSF